VPIYSVCSVDVKCKIDCEYEVKEHLDEVYDDEENTDPEKIPASATDTFKYELVGFDVTSSLISALTYKLDVFT